MDTKSKMGEFMRTCPDKIYHGDTSDAPYGVTCLIVFQVVSKPAVSEAKVIEARCTELSRHNTEFLRRIQEQGVFLYDEQNTPVMFTRKIEDVMDALAATGQRHFGPIIGGSGPRF